LRDRQQGWHSGQPFASAALACGGFADCSAQTQPLVTAFFKHAGGSIIRPLCRPAATAFFGLGLPLWQLLQNQGSLLWCQLRPASDFLNCARAPKAQTGIGVHRAQIDTGALNLFAFPDVAAHALFFR